MSILPFALPRRREASPVLIVAALATAAAAIVFLPAARLWPNVLQLGWYVTGLGLAAPFLLSMLDLAGARWHDGLRPIAARITALLPVGGVLVLIAVLFGGLYPPVAGNSFHAFWLARPFFLGRAFAYVALWVFFSRAVLQKRMRGLSLVILSLTVWLASVDWIMALDGSWASTIFGVYHFAGLFSAGIALLAMIAAANRFDGEVLHDLGKLLFGFSTFWMYIWFSQYMLIWYGNMPEETNYFASRVRGGWGVLFITDVLLNWVVPFVLLLPQAAKRNRVILFRVSAVVLVGHWIDLYLSIFPARLSAPAAGVGEVLALAAAIVLLRGCYEYRAVSHQGRRTDPLHDPQGA